MIAIGLRAAGSAKGKWWLDSALKNRTIASLSPKRYAFDKHIAVRLLLFYLSATES